MNRIIIGNIVSFIAAVLLGLSCWTRKPKRVFAYQLVENLILALSSVIFGSYSAAVSMLLSTVRMLVVLRGKYTKTVMVIFCVLLTDLGIALNTKGIIGLLPVLATLEFAYANYRFTEIKEIKWSLVVNLLLWDTYAFVIRDYASGITWAITLAVTLVSLRRLYRADKQNRSI